MVIYQCVSTLNPVLIHMLSCFLTLLRTFPRSYQGIRVRVLKTWKWTKVFKRHLTEERYADSK